jgi:hypothetical protein
MFTTKHPPAEVAQNKSRAAVGCALVPPALAAGLCIPLAVAEQDHQLRSAKTIERKCCLIVTCRHTHQKTGRGAYYLLLNEPIFCFWAPLIAQLLRGSRYWPGTPPPPPPARASPPTAAPPRDLRSEPVRAVIKRYGCRLCFPMFVSTNK